MKLATKILAWGSAFLFIVSLATCHFGVEHEINKIPPEHRAAMSDFDWIGAEWIMLGSVVMVVAVLLFATAFVLWLLQRQRAKSSGKTV